MNKKTCTLLASVSVLLLFAGGVARARECGDMYEGIRSAQLKYWTWVLGASASQTSGHLFFVPLPDGTPNNGDGSIDNPVIYVGAASFSVNSRSTLVLPISMYIGEGYTPESMTPDDSPSLVPRDSYLVQTVRLRVDGRTVLDSARTSLACAYVPAGYFIAPITYDPPEYRYTNDQGIDVYASAAMWVTGLAVNLPPLEPGQHRIHLYVDTRQGFGYDNTWTVNVKRRD